LRELVERFLELHLIVQHFVSSSKKDGPLS
jgi:hypothetical protein